MRCYLREILTNDRNRCEDEEGYFKEYAATRKKFTLSLVGSP